MASFKLKNIQEIIDPIFGAAKVRVDELNALNAEDEKNDARTAALTTFQTAFETCVTNLRGKVTSGVLTEAAKAEFLSQFERDQKAFVNQFKTDGQSTWQHLMDDLISKLHAVLRTVLVYGVVSESAREKTRNMFFTGGMHTDKSAVEKTETNGLREIFEEADANGNGSGTTSEDAPQATTLSAS